jgi:cytochrome c biogenesis protein CcmG/thiol:disulfide interchange protein DsbE
MIALTNRQWNMVFAGVLLVGSAFIATTRVGPSGGAAAPPAPVSADTAPAPLPDRPAPDFTLPTLDGTTVTLSKLKGQVALINIWATWCPPCRAEMPTIQATYEQYREQGFTVLAVDLQEDPRTVAGFMREFKLTFPALLDTDGAVSQAYQAYALPSSFFVDRKGIIRAVYHGPMPRGVIAGTIEQLLQEGT